MATLEEQDAEANVFAMELLMPEKMLRKDVEKMRKKEIDFSDAIQYLAKRYKVEPEIMTIRLTGLGYFGKVWK